MSDTRRTQRRGSRPDLRHDAARRRAVARHLAEHAGEAGDRPAAGAPRRGRDRGGLPDHLAGRLRVGAGDRARGRRPGDLRAGADQPAGHRGRVGRGQGLRAPAHPHVHLDLRHPHRAQAADHARGRQGPGARGRRAGARVHRGRRVLAEDGSRSDVEFTAEVIQIAIDEGATTINIPDTVGYTMPHEYAAMFERAVRAGAGAARRGRLGALPRRPGAGGGQLVGGPGSGRRQVECAINGIGERAGNASLEEIVMLLRTREPSLGLWTGVDTTRDRAHEPPGLAADRLPGAAEQGDRGAQRVRARVRHPPGRRAEGAHDLRDHGRHHRRAAQQLDRAGQALRPPRAAAKRWRRWASSSTARR